ncbi:hypothetical protein L2E82_30402 [Cichorium intybus]|uniref:Uncharacterized protein n=1 Tax=Cichorium intybus TaxID=13427 RepID=A0ACB9D073_CICIN|nr:hypothetical protein L2E82_30402 [Cichorium intybus]
MDGLIIRLTRKKFEKTPPLHRLFSIGLSTTTNASSMFRAFAVTHSHRLFSSIVEEGGIAALLEVIGDSTSVKGKEFAVVTLIQLCEWVNSTRNRALLVGERASTTLSRRKRKDIGMSSYK